MTQPEKLIQQPSRLSRNFYLLLTGNVVSVFGSSIYLLVIILHLKETTGSATLLGFYNFLALLPPVLLGPFAGALVDRWSRKHVIIFTDVIRGVLMLMLAGLALSPAGIQVFPLLVVTGIAGITQAFFLPAVQAIIPDLEPPHLLKRANSARAAGSQLSNLAGNALGGLVFSVFGLVPVLFANGVSFLLSALQESWIVITDQTRNMVRISILKETQEGFRYLMRRRGLRTLVLLNSMVFFLTPPLVLVLPFLVEDTLGLGTPMVGVFFSALLAGGISAYLLWGLIPISTTGDYRIFTTSFFLLSAVVLMIGLFLTPVVLFIGLFFAGASIGSIHLMINVVVQRSVSPSRRARIFSLIEASGGLTAPFAYLASGILIDLLLQELVLMFLGTSLVIALAGGIGLKSRNLRRLIR